MSETIRLNITRRLNFEKSGHVFSGTLCIDRLEKLSDRRWGCYWSCDYICEDGHVCGEDALHALLNCLSLVRDLILNAPSSGLSVWWQSPGDKCWMD